MSPLSASGAHVLCALVWFFLSPEPSLASFALGALLGFLLLLLFRDLFGARRYLRRWRGFFRFLGAFALAFARANLAIARAVLTRPRDSIHPSLVEYDVSHLGPWELFLLAQAISLTPGSTSVSVSDDHRILTVHAFEGRDPEEVRRSIREELEAPLLGFTR